MQYAKQNYILFCSKILIYIRYNYGHIAIERLFYWIHNMFYQNFALYNVDMKGLLEQVSTYQHCMPDKTYFSIVHM